MKCRSCGWNNPDTVTFCRKCGVQLVSSSLEQAWTSFPVPDALASFPAEQVRTKRRGMWRVIWIVLACLLIGGAGMTWWIISTHQASTGVTQTLQAYCSALQNADYPQAYAQWATGTQMNESDFAYTQQRTAKVTTCETGALSITNTTAQATLTFFYADGSSAVNQINLTLENGVWKIKSQTLL